MSFNVTLEKMLEMKALINSPTLTDNWPLNNISPVADRLLHQLMVSVDLFVLSKDLSI